MRSKRMKAPKRPKTTEKIHGKKVVIGKGLGERTGKRASSAIKLRKKKERELLKALMED